MATIINVGVARKLSDAALINAFFDDSHNRSKYHQVILERMHKHSYTDFFSFAWDTPDPSTQAVPKRTAPGKVLGPELQAILKTYPFPKNDGLYDVERCREFCTRAGGLYNTKESELRDKQRRMLGLIRDKCETWVRRHS